VLQGSKQASTASFCLYIAAIFTISNPKTPSDIFPKKTSLNKGKQNQNAR